MDPSRADAMYGKYFDFLIFENDDVKVQSAGHCIAIGLKSKLKNITYTWMIEYPFNKNGKPPTGCKWNMTIEETTKNGLKIFFRKNNTLHVLKLVCTDPDAKTKPIEVTWT